MSNKLKVGDRVIVVDDGSDRTLGLKVGEIHTVTGTLQVGKRGGYYLSLAGFGNAQFLARRFKRYDPIDTLIEAVYSP